MAQKLGKLAYRYAKALRSSIVEELGDNGNPTPSQEIADQLEDFLDIWEETQLAEAMTNPMFTLAERKLALLEIAKLLGFPDVVKRFLSVLVDRDRIGGLEEIIIAFEDIADKAARVVHVEVITAREVDPSERQAIESDLAQHIEGSPGYSWEVEPRLIGGMVVRYQGKVLDGSLSGRLERIQKDLMVN